jgi:hypothetical protein
MKTHDAFDWLTHALVLAAITACALLLGSQEADRSARDVISRVNQRPPTWTSPAVLPYDRR